MLISVLGRLNELIHMRAPVQRTDPRTGARFPGAWSPGSKRVALVDDAFVVRVWDLDGAAEMPAWLNRAARPTRATIRPDGARALLTTGRDVQEIELTDPTRAPRQLDEQVHHAAYHPDRGEVAALGSRGELLRWRPDTGELVREQPGAKFPQGATLAWNRDGTRVALRREAIEVVRVGAPGIERSLPCEGSTPSHFAWSPLDDALAIGCDNGELRVAELAAGGPPRVLPAREGRIVALAWSPDGQWIAVAHERGQGRVWRRDGAVDWKNLDGHLDQLLAVAWSPDGKRLATTGDDGVARLWSSDGVMLHSLLVPAKSVRTISFSSDNTRLATSATDGVVRVYSTSGGELLFALPSFGQEVTSAAFTPDGNKLLVSGRGGAALILADRALLRDWLTNHVPCMTPEALALALGGTDMAARSACSP